MDKSVFLRSGITIDILLAVVQKVIRYIVVIPYFIMTVDALVNDGGQTGEFLVLLLQVTLGKLFPRDGRGYGKVYMTLELGDAL